MVNAVHTGLFSSGRWAGVLRAMRTLGPLNLLSATLVLIGGFLPPSWRWGLWIAAVLVVSSASPYLNPIGEFTISPAHFVERHGLVIIIALGESVVAIGVGAAGLPVDLRPGSLVAVLGLSVAYLMWWVYFGGDDTEAEHALAAIDPAKRARAAIHAYGWAHLGLLLGIVAVAAGIKKAVGHADGHLELPQAALLAGGLALYPAQRRGVPPGAADRRVRYRAVAAVVALATIPLGLWMGAAQLARCDRRARGHALRRGPGRGAVIGWDDGLGPGSAHRSERRDRKDMITRVGVTFGAKGRAGAVDLCAVGPVPSVGVRPRRTDPSRAAGRGSPC